MAAFAPIPKRQRKYDREGDPFGPHQRADGIFISSPTTRRKTTKPAFVELIAPSRGELEECVIDFESSVLLHYASLDTRIAASTTTPHRATTKPRAKLAWQRTIDFFNKYLKA